MDLVEFKGHMLILNLHDTKMSKVARTVSSASRIVFYYDVVCPFAYMASTVVEDMASRAGATVEWKPVLLGGLYEATSAAQGKAGSATDVMCPAKLNIIAQDLHRQLKRRGVPFHSPTVHPQKTVYAMRLLAAIPDNNLRVALSHAFYKAYWCEDRDLADLNFLEEVSSSYGVPGKELLQSEAASKKLRENTSEAAMRGAFGVPSFYVNGKFYWGTDRMFFVERALGIDAHPERLMSQPSSGTATLTFYFDYSSPWSYLGFERLSQLAKDVYPVNLKIEWVPILLGALFKNIGTPNVPAVSMSEAKRNYYQQDLQDWCQYAGVELVFPQAFPLRTVLPLRVTLASGCDPMLIQTLYRAAWQMDKDIGDKEVLSEVLGDSKSLIEANNSETIKSQLFSNTTRAIDAGVCGVPSFQVNGGPIVWGQDKLNTVADMICGWDDPISKL